jgi:hypothetical protein
VMPSACGEIGSGWFIFALRDAAAKAGYYKTPAQASTFFGQLAEEILSACVRESLKCSAQLIAEMPPVNWDQIAEGFQRQIARIFSLLILPNPALQFDPSVGPEDQIEQCLRFLNFPVYTKPSNSQGMRETYALSGWYYKLGDDWLDIQIQPQRGSETQVALHLERRPSPDLVQAFNDPRAADQRLAIWVRCSNECVVAFRTGEGAVSRTLAELRRAPLGFEVGSGRVHFDSVVVRPNPGFSTPRTQELANSVREVVVSNYKFVFLPVVGIGAIAFVVLSLLRLRRALSNLSYVVALTCWMLVVLRAGLLTLIDVTSFPALNPSYLAPAYFLLVAAAVLSCAAWLQLFLMQGSRKR